MNQGKLEVVKQEIARVNEYRHFKNQWIKMDGNGWIYADEGIFEQNEKAANCIGENICKQYIL